MNITFSPMRRDDTLHLERSGDCLIVNGVCLDFSDLAEGDSRSAAALHSDWLAGPVRRAGGRLHLCLILPHGPNAPEQTLFPVPLTVEADGDIPVPPRQLDDAGEAAQIPDEI